MKKPLLKQGRFWFEIFLGLIIAFLTYCTFVVALKLNDVETALAKYEHVYNPETKGLVYVGSSTETTTKSETSGQIIDDEDYKQMLAVMSVIQADANAFSKDEVETALDDYYTELFSSGITDTERSNAKTMIDEILGYYETAAENNRKIGSGEQELISNNITQLSILLDK